MPSPRDTEPEAIHQAVMRAICVNLADTPMVLKGGTALLLCYGLDRHSQDLDFDSPRKMALQHRIQEAFGYRFRIIELKALKDTETVQRVRLRYADPETRLEGTVRIETSFRQPPVVSDVSVKNGIRVYKINKLFIQKTIAFYERTAARDFYDLAFLLDQSFIPDTQSLNRLHADFSDPEQSKSIEQRFRIAFETDPVLARYDFDKITAALSERIEHAYRRVQALEEYNAQVKTPADRARLLNENPALVAARDEAYQAFKSDQITQQLEQQ
jgi:predicted nucleotidyltransferase component of viral defense system